MRCFEIKNNMYHALAILKQDGTQVLLGSRQDPIRRKVVLREDEANKEQLSNLARLNIISVKKIKRSER